MENKENKRMFLSPPDMSGCELDYVKQAFESNYIAPLGPMLDEFEKVFSEYLDVSHCVGLSSGTAAMHLAIRHLIQLSAFSFQPSDVRPLVLASTLTFIGSVSPATFEDCDITFIDCDRESWNMDVALLKEALEECAKKNRLPLAVIPTDLYGQCSDLDAIQSVCQPYSIPVIVDAAESLGAEYKGAKSGKGAYASVYSFNGNKIITTSGGGMLATEDKSLADHARKLATQARDDAPHYEHSEIGYNYRMSNIIAAIGLGQMEVVDERVKRKREICDKYQELLGNVPSVEFMPEADYGKHNRWLTVVLIDESVSGVSPDKVRLALEAENIEARPLWKPMHMQPCFKDVTTVRGGAVAEDLFVKGLCLPSGTAMTDDDIERVADLVKQAIVA